MVFESIRINNNERDMNTEHDHDRLVAMFRDDITGIYPRIIELMKTVLEMSESAGIVNSVEHFVCSLSYIQIACPSGFQVTNLLSEASNMNRVINTIAGEIGSPIIGQYCEKCYKPVIRVTAPVIRHFYDLPTVREHTDLRTNEYLAGVCDTDVDCFVNYDGGSYPFSQCGPILLTLLENMGYAADRTLPKNERLYVGSIILGMAERFARRA